MSFHKNLHAGSNKNSTDLWYIMYKVFIRYQVTSKVICARSKGSFNLGNESLSIEDKAFFNSYCM